MAGKLMSMSEAIAEYVPDDSTVYLSGFTHLIPFAAGHEIIRQGIRGLTLCRATPDLIYDQMIAAGCARRVVFSWAGNPGVGLLRCFRRAVESGALEIEEYSHYGLIARLQAGATNLPFMPMKSQFGTDLQEENPQLKTVVCPYTGELLRTVPALKPDVAVVHVQQADQEGNCRVWGIIGEQREAAFASRTVIVSAEEIVEQEVIRSDPNRTLIPGFLVSAVVEAPWGAHPSYAQGYYDRDNQAYLEWDGITRTGDGVQEWLKDWVFGVRDRREYLAKLGPGRTKRLEVAPALSSPVDYGEYRDSGEEGTR